MASQIVRIYPKLWEYKLKLIKIWRRKNHNDHKNEGGAVAESSKCDHLIYIKYIFEYIIQAIWSLILDKSRARLQNVFPFDSKKTKRKKNYYKRKVCWKEEIAETEEAVISRRTVAFENQHTH